LSSISDLATGLFIAISLFAILLSTADSVDKRIKANIEEASKTGAVGKRRLKTLNWPRDAQGQGLLLFGLSALLFAIQILTSPILAYIPFLQRYEVFAYGAEVCGLVGGFYLALVVKFILNPRLRPRITLLAVLYAPVIIISDVMMILLLLRFYSFFTIYHVISVGDSVVLIAIILSIVCSIPFWWSHWKGTKHWQVLFLPLMAPYVLILSATALAWIEFWYR
jgi:hypothetical protein